MKSKLLFIFLLYGIIPVKAQPFNPLLAGMLHDTLITYSSQISNIKGISASVYIPGQGIWNDTYGVSYSGHPITSDMRFGIASNSKLFVSAAMLILAENNALTLDDSLHTWLPAYPNVNPDITIRQLLNHTSGISDPIFVSPLFDTINANPSRVFTPNEVLSYLGPPTFAPGTGWSYSNVNYILAGMIVKNATGINLSKIIRDSILTPLDLDSSFYDVEEPETGILAHRWWNGIDYHDTSRVALNTAAGAAGALFSTSSEMVQWYAALFGGQILSQNSMSELTHFVATSNPYYRYGLGLAKETTQGKTYYTHGGDTWGYKSKMIHDTCQGIEVCVLSNSFPSGMPAVTFLLYRVVKNHIPGCSAGIAGADTVCAGAGGVTYSVPPIPNATSYLWILPSGATGSSTTNSITVDFGLSAVSGTITVRGVNNYGPGGNSSLYVTVIPLPPTPVIVQNGNTLTSDAPSGNQWYDENGMIAGETDAALSISQSGSYYCIVTLQGCSSDTSNVINAVYTGLSANDRGNSISVFPNPFSSSTTIKSDGGLINATLTIYNSTGQKIKQLNGISGKSLVIDRNELTPGFWFMRLCMDGKLIAERKLIITE